MDRSRFSDQRPAARRNPEHNRRAATAEARAAVAYALDFVFAIVFAIVFAFLDLFLTRVKFSCRPPAGVEGLLVHGLRNVVHYPELLQHELELERPSRVRMTHA